MQSFEDHLRSIMGCDVYHSEFGSVVRHVSAGTRQEDLLKVCQSAYLDRRCLTTESSRICFARALVAVLPRSLSFIEEVLRPGRDLLDFEVHFSLFCYLDQVQWHDPLRPASTRVLSLVRDYLMRAERDQALASWMAADLMAEHWEFPEALGALADVARHGQTSAGRVEAILAIAKMAKRTPPVSDYHFTVHSLAQLILSSEKDEKVRLVTQRVLSGAAG